jgi:uncharacterized damage-inducible protein DinB
MSISQSLLPEFDHEMANTRKVLEQVPDDKLSWKAHANCNSIGWVAAHLVEIPGWVEGTLTQDAWDINPPGGEPYQSPVARSRKEILAQFDQNVKAARAALEKVSDADILKKWSLLNEGKPLFTMPRIGVIRSFVLNHLIHHRAFLCAYLRMNDVAVPGMYGV